MRGRNPFPSTWNSTSEGIFHVNGMPSLVENYSFTLTGLPDKGDTLPDFADIY
jgi:hypothetical protein